MKEEEEIRAKIIDAAGRMYMRLGLRSVSMDDIARELGMSKKTIYQHFKDKNELVETIVVSHMESEHCRILEIGHEAENRVEEVYQLGKFIRHMVDNMNPTLLYDLKKYHRRAWELFQEQKLQKHVATIANTLRKGQQEGVFRADFTPEVLAHMRMAQIEWTMDTDTMNRELQQVPYTDIMLQLFEHFIHGIVTDKGRTLLNQYNLQNTEPNA